MLDQAQLRKYVSALEKGDDAARRVVLTSLKAHEMQEWTNGPSEGINTLIESLRQQLSSHQLLKGVKQPSIHKEVAAILGNMGPRSKTAIPEVVDLLNDGVPDSVREAAVTALGKIGRDAKVAVDQLIGLTNGRNSLAVHAVRALGDIGCADHRVKNALVGLWTSPMQTQTSQVQVAFALCKLKIDAQNLPAVLTSTLMSSQDATLRKSAAEALAWCSKDAIDVVPALLNASLADKNEDVQNVAKAGLEHLRLTPDKAARLCAKQLDQSLYAEAALRKSGQIAVPALIEALASGEALVRVKAIRTLSGFGELAVEAVPALTKALKDNDPEVRLAAAKGVWNVTKVPEVAVPVLIGLLQEKRSTAPDVSEARRMFLQSVIEALWRIGPPATAAVPALLEKIKDKNRLVSESARDAVKKILPSAIK